MLLTGEMIETEDAERWGLVNRMVPEDHLEEVTMALTNKFAKKSPVALNYHSLERPPSFQGRQWSVQTWEISRGSH